MRTIKEDFIPYAHTGMGGSNTHRILTATGKLLADEFFPEDAIRKGMEEWARLPEAERKPRFPSGLPKIKGYTEPPSPPKNGLILRAHMRALQRDLSDGSLLWTGRMDVGEGGYGIPPEPQIEFVWITEKEWQAMLPADPQVGASVPIPKSVVDRLMTFHMMDKGLGCTFFWEKTSGEMKLTVIHAAESGYRMRIEGRGQIDSLGDYPIRFQGFVEYHSRTRTITRFDMIAMGKDGSDTRPAEKQKQRHQFSYVLQPNCAVVLAIAFERVEGNKELERVPPFAVMFDSKRTYNRPYLPE